MAYGGAASVLDQGVIYEAVVVIQSYLDSFSDIIARHGGTIACLEEPESLFWKPLVGNLFHRTPYGRKVGFYL